MNGITAETLALAKAALANGQPLDMAKGITVSTGLTAYDLQAPAKNIYPTITPLRNKMPRTSRATPGDAARWRSILGITGSGFDSMGWVPEGQRSASMSYNTVPYTAPYVTLGEEDYFTFEAESAAVGFEDINATASMRLLQKLMRKEETAILGGNKSLQLGTPAQPVVSSSGTGSTLPSLTYSVIVVALSFEGYRNSSLTLGVATQKTIVGNDGLSYTLNGGCSNRSPNNTQVVTNPAPLLMSVTPIAGAMAYAWFIGAVGAETLQAITTINSYVQSTALTAGTQPISQIGGDYSTNPNYAYDGLLSVASNPANGSLVTQLATGTPGTGTLLTASGRGSVNEIDQILLTMWNSYRLSPTIIWVNAQEQKNITTKCLTASSGPLLRYNVDAISGNAPQGITAGGVVRWYYNPFSVDGGKDIPIMVHPDLPPGTILFQTEVLPEWYQSNEIPQVATIIPRRDYYRIDWPITSRRRQFGTYCESVLAVYVPFAYAILQNIGNG